MSKDRIDWIDNLKAIGIYLMVLGHHETMSKDVVNYIYSFHMALFFFISGFLFYYERYPTIKGFALQRIKTLIVPYFVFSFITFIIFVLFTEIRHPEQIASGKVNLIDNFFSIFVSANGIIMMSHNPPLWFLTCLFLTEIQFYFICQALDTVNFILKKAILIILATLIMSIFGYLDYLFFNIHFPWSLETSWTIMIIYSSGYLLRQWLQLHIYKPYSNKISFLKFLPVIFVLITISIISSQINSFVNLAYNKTGNYFLFLISAFSGIVLFSILSLLLTKITDQFRLRNIFKFVGRNTIFILGFNSIGIYMCVALTYFLNIHGLFDSESFFVCAALSVIQVLLLLPLIPVTKKILPIFPR